LLGTAAKVDRSDSKRKEKVNVRERGYIRKSRLRVKRVK